MLRRLAFCALAAVLLSPAALAATASLTTNQSAFTLNSGEILYLSGGISAGPQAGTLADIYVKVSVYDPQFLGDFYLGADLAWTSAAVPIVANFPLADISAPNFYATPVAGIPAGTYAFEVRVVPAGRPSSWSAYLAIAQSSVTISQPAQTSVAQAPGPTAPPCTYYVYPASHSYGPEGDWGTVEVEQREIACLVANPPWTITSNAAWITSALPGALSNGQGPAYYYVQPNSTASARSATVTVAGNTHTVTQSSGINPFQGSYSGTWSGSCTLFGAVSGSFTMNIAANGTVTGSYSGSDSGSLSGSVGADGSFSTASGVAAGGAYWIGQFSGRSGSGSWSEPGCAGGWATR